MCICILYIILIMLYSIYYNIYIYIIPYPPGNYGLVLDLFILGAQSQRVFNIRGMELSLLPFVIPFVRLPNNNLFVTD